MWSPVGEQWTHTFLGGCQSRLHIGGHGAVEHEQLIIPQVPNWRQWLHRFHSGAIPQASLSCAIAQVSLSPSFYFY